jgi:hypothetical protein
LADRYNPAAHIPRMREYLELTFPSNQYRYLPFGSDCQPVATLEVPTPLLELDRFFQKGGWGSLDDAFIRQLLDFLARNISEQIPSIPPRHALPGFIGPLQATHRQITSVLHGIASAAILNLPAHCTADWIRGGMLRALIAGLGSPDESEYGSVRTLLGVVCDAFPDFQALVCDLMRDRLSLAPFLPHQAINGHLQFITNFYRANPLNFPPFHWFTSTVLPLFASAGLPMFHGALERLCILFDGYFDESAIVTLKYLLRHWPATYFPKIELYLESSARAVAALREDLRRRIARPLFARIADVLASGHMRASGAALRLLGDDRFLGLFTPDARAPLAALQGRVAALAHSDTPEERLLAANAMAAIARRCDTAFAAPQPPREDDRVEKWRIVRTAAGEDGG